MPHYYLHLHNGLGFVRDEEGLELPDVAAARAQAISGIRSIVSDEVLQGCLSLAGKIEIVGDDGAPISVVRFDEAISIVPDSRP